MLKEKRDAVRQIAERWKLSVHAADWEPKRFLTDVSALVLRFGGKCELVWLNDKNALAVFSDPARAATAMRRLDHGSAYHGAVVVPSNGAASSSNPWGGGIGAAKDGSGALAASGLKTNPWKKAVVQDSGWKEDSWGTWSAGGGADMQTPSWRRTETPIVASMNRYNILDQDSVSTSTISVGLQKLKNHQMESSSSTSTMEPKTKASVLTSGGQSGGDGIVKQEELSEVVDDYWEKAYE